MIELIYWAISICFLYFIFNEFFFYQALNVYEARTKLIVERIKDNNKRIQENNIVIWKCISRLIYLYGEIGWYNDEYCLEC